MDKKDRIPSESDNKKLMGRNAWYTASGVFLSSFFGFLLYFTIGRFFGAGKVSDAFFAANIIWILFLTFASTFRYTVSVMLASQEKRDDFKTLEGEVLFSVLIFIVPMCFITYFFSPTIAVLLGVGFDEERIRITLNLVKIMIPGLLFVCAGFVFSSSLGARGVFSVPASALASLNAVAFLVFILLRNRFGIYSAAFGLTSGSLVFLLILVLGIIRKGLFPHLKILSPSVFFKILTSIFAGAGIYVFNQLNYWTIQSFSSFFSEGIPSIYAYSATITAFLIYIISFPISVVSTPTMARQRESVEKYFIGALRLNSLFSIPAAVMVFLFADSFSAILFSGSFTQEQVYTLGLMLKLYISVVIAGGVSLQFFSLFFSMDMKRQLFISGLISIPVNLFLLLVLTPYAGYYSLMISQFGYTLLIIFYLLRLMPSLKVQISHTLSALFQIDVIIYGLISALPVKLLILLTAKEVVLSSASEILKISFAGVIYLVSFIFLLKYMSPAKYEEVAGIIKK